MRRLLVWVTDRKNVLPDGIEYDRDHLELMYGLPKSFYTRSEWSRYVVDSIWHEAYLKEVDAEYAEYKEDLKLGMIEYECIC